MSKADTPIGIIYRATNPKNGKVYVGLTHRSFPIRLRAYKTEMRRKGNVRLFVRALRKYGIENFEWSVLCECFNEEDLILAEKFFIEFYNSSHLRFGYNITQGGIGVSKRKVDVVSAREDYFLGMSKELMVKKHQLYWQGLVSRISEFCQELGEYPLFRVKQRERQVNTMKSHGNMLSDEIADRVMVEYDQGLSFEKISKMLSIGRNSVSRIVKRRTKFMEGNT
jgi:group I intron endonuclease